MPDERRETGHVLVTDVEAVRAQLLHRSVHVPRWNARLRCGMGPAQAEVAHSPHLPAVSAVIAHSAACRAASAEGKGAQL